MVLQKLIRPWCQKVKLIQCANDVTWRIIYDVSFRYSNLLSWIIYLFEWDSMISNEWAPDYIYNSQIGDIYCPT